MPLTANLSDLFRSNVPPSGGGYVGDNILINSDFSYNQGSTYSIDFDENGWLCDRWYGEGIGDVSGYLSKDASGHYAIFSTGVTGNAVAISQRIEEDLTLQGQEVTLSFTAEGDITATNQEIDIYCGWYEEQGSAMSTTTINTVALSGGAQFVSITFTVPYITAFDNSTDYTLNLRLRFNLGDDLDGGEIKLRPVKFERGTEATEWIKPAVAENVAECQRYSFILRGSLPIGIATDTGGAYESAIYRVPQQMRGALRYVARSNAPQMISTSATGNFACSYSDSVFYSDRVTWEVRTTDEIGGSPTELVLNGSSSYFELCAEITLLGDTFGETLVL